MAAIIVLNIVFAVLVVGGIVGLLAHAVWASRPQVAVEPRRERVRREPARRLASVNG